MTAQRLSAALVTLFVLSGTAHAGLLDKAKKAAKSAAKTVGDGAKSVGYAAKSIAIAAVEGVEAFPKGVKTTDLLTTELENQCPGITARTNGCSVPLYDAITKKFKTLLKPACDDHDVCYNLSDAKQACDTAFRDRMYKLCDGLSAKKTLGLCRVAAHTWFSAVAHSDSALTAWKTERTWAKATCKPVPELTTLKTIKKR